MMRHLLAAMFALLPAIPAAAQPGFKGEINAEAGYASNSTDSLDAALGEREHRDLDANLRLMWSGAVTSGWNLDVAYLAETRHGGGVALTRSQRMNSPVPYVDADRAALWHLGRTVSDHDQVYTAHRLDRLALGYSGSKLVLRVGRQALTWGSGLVFHPMDLFDPFPPNATYTTYKPGADMLYGQWLYDNGADIQGVMVPRRDPVTSRVAGTQSSAGAKWHGFAGRQGELGIDLLLARDYRTVVFGIGASGALDGASWSTEIVPAQQDGSGMCTSLLANAQYAWNWEGLNVDGYLEYFRNGFGMRGSGYTLAELPAALNERLARGETFTVSRDYLAAGIALQLTPLFSLKPLLISNLNDGSALLIGQAVYSLSQNTNLTAGMQWGIGRRGTEYGGLETAVNSNLFAVPANQLYARLTWYL
jgi:hypothetical protein